MWSQMDEELHLETQTPEHRELMSRLRKTLYYGGLKMPQCKVLTKPLAELVSRDTFADTHEPYSLLPENIGKIKANPCSLILALIYLDLLKELDSQYVRRVPPSELLLVAMMVSTKFYSGYDEDVYLADWADYGELSVERLKALEIEFLDAMNWKIYVSNETFFKKLGQIERVLAERETQSRRHGWLTYTELCTLMPSIEVIRKAISYSALLAVSYTAGVIALAGAFFVASQVPGSYLCERNNHCGSTTTTTTGHTSTSINTSSATGTSPSGSVSPSDNGDTNTSAVIGDGTGGIVGGLSELEQRLIVNGVAEWVPISTADEDGKRIHLNRGTDYWSTTASITITTTTTGQGFNNATEEEENEENEDSELAETLARGIIRRQRWQNENETRGEASVVRTGTPMLDIGEWSPFQNNHHDLSFLSYLWLKFL